MSEVAMKNAELSYVHPPAKKKTGFWQIDLGWIAAECISPELGTAEKGLYFRDHINMNT